LGRLAFPPRRRAAGFFTARRAEAPRPDPAAFLTDFFIAFVAAIFLAMRTP
jgi:hypothetical protein